MGNPSQTGPVTNAPARESAGGVPLVPDPTGQMEAPMHVPNHPSSLALQEFVAGALPQEEAARLQDHLRACRSCEQEREALMAATQHFASEVLTKTLPMVRRRRARQRVVSFAAASATIAALLVLLVLAARPPEPARVAIASKGGVVLKTYARRGERIFVVHDGARLSPGDELRFVVEPAGQSFLLIASVDGSGRATVYHPFDGRESAPIVPGRRVELEGSVVLDRSPGPERLFVFATRTPLDAAQVRAQLESLGRRGARAIREETRLPLTDAQQTSLLFEKAERIDEARPPP